MNVKTEALMMQDETYAPSDACRTSKLLKSCSDPLRLQVLSVLSNTALAVLELSAVFDVRQNGMSHHLKTLANASLVTTRREGNTIFYRRNDAILPTPLAELRDAIFLAADQIVLDERISANLAEVFEKRAKAALQFFVENATAFKQQQDLIAELDVYGPEVDKLIGEKHLGARDHVLEVGPGTGEFLPSLAKQFKKVTALELSQSMLEQSQALCRAAKIDNVDFVLGDTSQCQSMRNSIDCVVLNMVLHHTAVPSKIFQEISNAIKPKGTVIICDLSEHNQDWVKEACGDQWLGFSSHDLKNWATRSGFALGVERYFALRNGFQIQIHQFIKQ